MITEHNVKKVVTILKLLQDARNIDKKYNTLPAIIANRNMNVWIEKCEGLTIIGIGYEEHIYQIPLSYQDMYYEGFDSLKVRDLIQRAINTLVYQVEHKPKENNYEKRFKP